MTHSRKAIFVFLALVLTLALAATVQAETPKHMLTSISTTDVNRAAMAIKFTHGAMKQQGVPATLFFNVDGVRLVNKNIPSPNYATGESIQMMLEKFMQDGGKVLACPMCMKNVAGMTNADLMPGVHAKPGAGQQAMFADGTLVLSY